MVNSRLWIGEAAFVILLDCCLASYPKLCVPGHFCAANFLQTIGRDYTLYNFSSSFLTLSFSGRFFALGKIEEVLSLGN